MKPTHILMFNRSTDQEDLYDTEGMLIASRSGDIVRFGKEPKETGGRLFLTKEQASKWLRKLAAMEIVTRKNGNLTLADVIEPDTLPEVCIEERDSEKNVILPGGRPVSVLRN